ncbi:hypothetical protein [Aquiflexum sp.]|uniref:hypothetical protein n=1 Tax=Aquiflexum sp. TaxID=1872584 RepID=UPI00359382E3
MLTLFKNFKIGMIAFGAIVFMMVAGWQFGVGGTEEVFSDKEVALENALAGSGGEWVCCQSFSTGCPTYDGSMYFPWDYAYWGGSFCP